MARCFIAIDLDEDIKNKIIELQKKIADPNLRMVSENNLHITILFLDELNEHDVKKTMKELETVEFSSFTLDIKDLGVFPNDSYIRVLWLGIKSEELINLARQIYSRLGKKFDFTAHLTIARAKGRPKINLKQKAVIGKQAVTNFKLKKSTLIPSGPVYQDLKTYNSV